VDHDERRREVAQAAIRLLARSGPSGLTLRALADELGGSITIVTHFFRNRSEILDAVTQLLIEDSAVELGALGGEEVTAEERVRGVLEWLLPLSDEALALERSRVMMVAESDSRFNVQQFYDTWETKTRDLIAEHLPAGIPPDSRAFYVDLVRVLQNGVILSAVEHPKYWTGDKQYAFIDGLVELFRTLGLFSPGDGVM
jgi:AcrR family transcriptional regulator